MPATGDRAGQDSWQAPLEADPVDAAEQSREVGSDDLDPEAPVSGPGTAGLDLGSGSEADLADQLAEVGDDDGDGDR
jgi:hypothetical protein